MESSTAIQKKGTDRADNVVQLLGREFQRAFPRHMRANLDRYQRVALTTLRENPKLLQCTEASLFGSMMHAAQLGLDIGGTLGQAYLIPRRNKGQMTCCFQVGYKGLKLLAERSPKVSHLKVGSVFANDHLVIQEEPPVLEHSRAEGNRGEFIGAYAVGVLENGMRPFEYMNKAELDAHRAKYTDEKSKLWNDYYESACQKTVATKLCKWLPSSVETQAAVALNELADARMPQPPVELVGADFKVVPPEPDRDLPPDRRVPEESGGEPVAPSPAPRPAKKSGRPPRKNEEPEFEECIICGNDARICDCEPGSGAE